MSMVRTLAAYPTTITAALPANPDDGFPQSFRFALGGAIYQTSFYVNVTEQLMPPVVVDPRAQVDVIGDDPANPVRGLLVGVILREGDPAPTPVLHRRLLPGLVYQFSDLVLIVDAIAVALGNLNGAGSFGSALNLRVGTP